MQPDTIALLVGESTDLTAEVTGASADSITWESSQPSVASVDAGGTVTAHAPGETTVTASNGGKSDSASVSVSEVHVASVALSPDSLNLTVGESGSLEAIPKDADGNVLERTVAWESLDSSVVVVDDDGTVTAQYPGSATVRATSGTATNTAQITVEDDRPTVVYPGESLQDAVTSQPPGTQFLLKRGIHRQVSVRPKDGNTFVGETGAVLSGSSRLTGFQQEGSAWVLDKEDINLGPVNGDCQPDYPRCDYPVSLFVDEEPLRHVSSLGDLTNDAWYFDFGNDRIYLARNPTNSKVELTTRRYAFEGAVSNVSIRNLIIEKYASPVQYGAVQAGEEPWQQILATGWTIEDCEIRLNNGGGIRTGNSITIRDNYIHHNGETGIIGGGQNILIEDNEIAYNSIGGFRWAWWGGSGAVIVHAEDVVLRSNNVHHNDGVGLWTDIDVKSALYENNVVYHNSMGGILHEISYDTVIRNNEVYSNGFGWDQWFWGAGIIISSSRDVTVEGNIVRDNFNGITAIQQDRGSGKYGEHLIKNLTVRDNNVDISSGGHVGLIDGRSSSNDSIYKHWNNSFESNSYCLGSEHRPFYWGGYLTADQWQEKGQDSSGSFDCI